MTSDLYKLLGVRRNASLATIRAAYRKQSKTAHPDAPGGSQEKFNALKLAHDVLTNPAARAHYDTSGQANAPKPDQGRGEVLAVLASALDAVINSAIQHGADPASFDMVAACCQVLKHGIAELDKQIGAARKREATYLRIAGRFSAHDDENMMDCLVGGHLGAIGQQIRVFEAQKRMAEEAFAIAYGHAFTFEPKVMSRVIFSTSSATTKAWY